MPPEDKWLLLCLLTRHKAMHYLSHSSTTRTRELNHLWEVFLIENADFSRLNILR